MTRARCKHGAPWWREDCLGCLDDEITSPIPVVCGKCGRMRPLGSDCARCAKESP